MLIPALFEVGFIAVLLWIKAGGDPSWHYDRMEMVMGAVIFVLVSAFMIFLGAETSMVVRSLFHASMDDKPSTSVDLVSLRSADGVQGKMGGAIFLMTGYIGSQQYYYWYEQASDALTPRQVAAGQGIYVYEEDRKDGHLDIFEWHYHSRLARLFMWPMNDDSDGETYHFHVPKGSIQRGFNLQ